MAPLDRRRQVCPFARRRPSPTSAETPVHLHPAVSVIVVHRVWHYTNGRFVSNVLLETVGQGAAAFGPRESPPSPRSEQRRLPPTASRFYPWRPAQCLFDDTLSTHYLSRRTANPRSSMIDGRRIGCRIPSDTTTARPRGHAWRRLAARIQSCTPTSTGSRSPGCGRYSPYHAGRRRRRTGAGAGPVRGLRKGDHG